MILSKNNINNYIPAKNYFLLYHIKEIIKSIKTFKLVPAWIFILGVGLSNYLRYTDRYFYAIILTNTAHRKQQTA